MSSIHQYIKTQKLKQAQQLFQIYDFKFLEKHHLEYVLINSIKMKLFILDFSIYSDHNFNNNVIGFKIYALIVTTDATPLPEQTKFSKTHLNPGSGIATIIHSHS
ncbi:unnamed protein product [Rotaria socialis]